MTKAEALQTFMKLIESMKLTRAEYEHLAKALKIIASDEKPISVPPNVSNVEAVKQ